MNFGKVSLLPTYLSLHDHFVKKKSHLFYLDDYGLTAYTPEN